MKLIEIHRVIKQQT